MRAPVNSGKNGADPVAASAAADDADLHGRVRLGAEHRLRLQNEHAARGGFEKSASIVHEDLRRGIYHNRIEGSVHEMSA